MKPEQRQPDEEGRERAVLLTGEEPRVRRGVDGELRARLGPERDPRRAHRPAPKPIAAPTATTSMPGATA